MSERAAARAAYRRDADRQSRRSFARAPPTRCARADRILAEDTRVTAKLLQHIGAKVPMSRYDDHSSETERERIVARLGEQAIALVSDAGTPLISDPGYKLVRAARAAGHAVHTVPGPSAAIAALTLAGLPTDRFLFLGFLPAKAKARGDAIAEVAARPRHAGALRKRPAARRHARGAGASSSAAARPRSRARSASSTRNA